MLYGRCALGKQQVQLFNDNFQNFKKYNIPKAQLVIADIPYNIGTNAYSAKDIEVITPEQYEAEFGGDEDG